MNNAPTIPVTEFTGISNKIDPQALGLGGFVQADNVDIDSTGKRMSCRDGRALLSSASFLGAYATLDKSRCYVVDAAGNLARWVTAATTLRSSFSGYPYWAQIGNVVFVGNENQVWRIKPDNSVQDNALAQPDMLKLDAVPGTLPAGQYRFVQVSVVNGRESAPSTESSIVVDGTQNIQVSGITGQRIYVCPANSQVFGWWRDTAYPIQTYASSAESLGEELQTNNLQPMPNGRCLTFYQSRLHCSIYDQANDQSVIFRSMPFWWDLCDPMDFKLVPGEVRAMAAVDGGLVVGTDRQIGAFVDDVWTTFAEYGVPRGQPIAYDAKVAGEETKQCWIWTQRGVLKALPFLEVTPQFAPPGGDFCGAAVVRRAGDERFVATLSPVDTPDNAA